MTRTCIYVAQVTLRYSSFSEPHVTSYTTQFSIATSATSTTSRTFATRRRLSGGRAEPRENAHRQTGLTKNDGAATVQQDAVLGVPADRPGERDPLRVPADRRQVLRGAGVIHPGDF